MEQKQKVLFLVLELVLELVFELVLEKDLIQALAVLLVEQRQILGYQKSFENRSLHHLTAGLRLRAGAEMVGSEGL